MWHLTTDTLLYVPESDGQAVIYQIASGDTHLVSALAGQVVLHLQSAAATTDTLHQHIINCTPGQDTVELQQMLKATLGDLQQLDLITDTAV